MLSIEQVLGESGTPNPDQEGNGLVDAVGTEPTEPITDRDAPTSAAARILRLLPLPPTGS